jgi:uncharacterized surface protein with fasciclin (FAS1) repeats
MQHLAIAAIIAALAVGAGAGAVTTVGSADSSTASSLSDVANPMIAGQAMLTGETIFANAARSPEHTKFVDALKDSGVADILKGKGTFTVFAPTDEAFASMPAGARGALFGPGHRSDLARSMRYLIVRGRLDSTTLLRLIGEGGGDVKLKTIEGGTITATLNGPTNISLMDEKGDVADIVIYDIVQSNGVIQVIDRVMTPAAAASRPTVVGMMDDRMPAAF